MSPESIGYMFPPELPRRSMIHPHVVGAAASIRSAAARAYSSWWAASTKRSTLRGQVLPVGGDSGIADLQGGHAPHVCHIASLHRTVHRTGLTGQPARRAVVPLDE